MSNPDNPSYLTLTGMNGKYCVTLMEWDHIEEAYKVGKCISYTTKGQALVEMMDLAKQYGLEVR